MKKNTFLFAIIISLLFSCKKNKEYNPDEHISYSHWYKTRSNSSDTLFSVYIPNAFSPGGDGINDTFYPSGYFNNLGYNLKIFGNNGNVVFNTNDRNMSWNGKINASGYFVQIGCYIYKLKLNDAMGKEYEYEGSVTLYK